MDVTIFDDDDDDDDEEEDEVEEMVEEQGGVVDVEVVTDADLVVEFVVPVISFTFATFVGDVTLDVGTLLELKSKESMPVLLPVVLGAVGHALVVT